MVACPCSESGDYKEKNRHSYWCWEYRSVADDWHKIEDVLNAVSEIMGDPLYTQVEEAKSSLFRIASRASNAAGES